jgi:hypothetical protein
MNGAAAAAPAGPRLWLFALLAGGVAFAISCLLLSPNRAVFSFGETFAAMSNDPFAWRGLFPHRVLGPLAAWALGLSGDRYWLFAHGTVVLFLAVVAGVARSRGASPFGSLLLAAAIAVTGAAEVYKGLVGYPEPLAFALLLLAAASAHHAVRCWTFAFLALLNHEGALFFWPWLAWLRVLAAGGVRPVDLVTGGVSLAGYLAIRWAILSAAPQPTHGSEVYTPASLAETAAMWATTAVGAVVYFGLVPLLLAWHAAAHGWRVAAGPLLLALAAVLAMTALATDMPRFVGYLALPATFAGSALLLRPRGVLVLAGGAVVTAVAIVLQRRVVGIYYEGMLRHLGAAERQVAIVRDLWWLFAAYGVAIAAMVAAGLWLGRRTRIAVAAAPAASATA